jgi:hypothetical protein
VRADDCCGGRFQVGVFGVGARDLITGVVVERGLPRVGVAQRHDLAQRVPDRDSVLKPFSVALLHRPGLPQLGERLLERPHRAVVRGFAFRVLAGVVLAQVGAVAGEHLDPLLTRRRRPGCRHRDRPTASRRAEPPDAGELHDPQAGQRAAVSHEARMWEACGISYGVLA